MFNSTPSKANLNPTRSGRLDALRSPSFRHCGEFSLPAMDWQGQKRSEILMLISLVVFGVVAFGVGYAIGSFQIMMLIYGSGVVLTALITVPNWPLFNRHPLKWLDPSEADRHPKPQANTATSKKKVSKQK
ncbi:probable signal peptidase complex subunit 1 [Phoenix dactylifera]|uniref:Signal peptidase complex subunit 1 n=1 Tax=Phoenix dactylifera TaxID=42345 RepID=A0A8B7C6I8_PHODC|nr:probable signal peptidase complex subunit 1 [Phoenix dactylifera]